MFCLISIALDVTQNLGAVCENWYIVVILKSGALRTIIDCRHNYLYIFTSLMTKR